MAENKYGERVIKIVFPFSLDDLEKIRSLPGRIFHGEEKCWSAPVDISSIKSLLSWGFTIDNHLQTFMDKINGKIIEIRNDMKIPGLKGMPYPFQREGIAHFEVREGRALNGDDMGLGKSLQALGFIQLHRDKTPVIIVCPTSLKLNWERECYKWLPNPSTEILSGGKNWKPTAGIIILNYDIVSDWVDTLRKLKPKIVILDEGHYIKNNKAIRTKAVKILCKGVDHVMILTGTPIESRPAELYNAINLIDSGLFPNRWHFLQKYCNPKYNGFGWNFNGSTNSEELHRILVDTIMIRRKKSDVLKDLPDKTRTVVPIELINKDEYYSAEDDFISYLKRTKGIAAAEKASNAEAFASIEGLKQLAVKGKLSHSIDWIKDFLELEEKLVVFATHKFAIEALISEFSAIAVKVDGSVSSPLRQQAVDKFQNDPKVRLFIGNIQAAGIGITLTASSNVAFLEYPWNPSQLDQAEDRVHRIGQKDAVNIYYLLSMNTIEERIVNLLDSKRKVIDAILDGVETDQSSLLGELLKEYV
jgi:SWI/SNF-related matrix-associated actin-dependent regulator 1 of chromatin subfamily A